MLQCCCLVWHLHDSILFVAHQSVISIICPKLHSKVGISALMRAVDRGHASVVKLLLDATADVNLADNVR